MSDSDFKHKEKIIDIAIILYSILSYYSFDINKIFSNKIYELIIILVSGIFISYYVLNIYSSSYINSNSKFLKQIATLAIINILLILALGIPIPWGNMENNMTKMETYILYARFLSIAITIMSISTFLSFSDENDNNENSKEVEEKKINTNEDEHEDEDGFMIILLILLSISWFIGSIYFVYKFGWLIGIILSILTVITMPFLINGYENIQKNSFYSNYFLPFLIGLVFSLWGDYIAFRYINPKFSVINKLIIFLFSGIFAMRVLVLFEPPIKRSSIITGLISTIFFMYSLGIFS